MATSRQRKLNVRRQRFVEEYLVSLSATRAAKAAGYAERTAYSQGQRLLKNVEVRACVEQAQEARAERIKIDADKVLEELAIIAFSHILNYEIDGDGNVTLADGAPFEVIKAIGSVKRKVTTRGNVTTKKVEIKLWNKVAALRLVGAHLGLFSGKVKGEPEADKAYRALLQFAKEQREARHIIPTTPVGQ